MKKPIFGCVAAVIVLIIFLVASGAVFTVSETEQVVITEFGKAKVTITEPGLNFKIPFIQKIHRYDNRILEWDGPSSAMSTQGKKFIEVDTYARWRIADPLLFLKAVTDERRARSRLDDILGSETRGTIAKHKLIEVIRSTKDRKVNEGSVGEDDKTVVVSKLIPISRGRIELEQDIVESSRGALKDIGIELLDLRFKRINYNEDVRKQIYERMISERQQIAERFRSEGQGEAAKILGSMERDLKKIKSEAYKTVETMKGEADATATEIYAKAYNVSPESAEFYQFLRTMELYEEMLAGESTVILSTDSDLFKYLKRVKPLDVPKPSPLKTTPGVNQPAPNNRQR